MIRLAAARLWLVAAFVATASSALSTPCSRVQRPGAFSNVSTIVDSLALQDNEQVQQFVADTQDVALFEMYQCTYEYNNAPVLVVTAICDSADLSRCVTLATYQGTECSKATLCQDFFNEVPSFTADCSGIASDFGSCAVACSTNSSEVTGLESCVAADAVTSSPAPSPTGGGTGGTSGAGDLATWREGGFLAVLGQIAGLYLAASVLLL